MTGLSPVRLAPCLAHNKKSSSFLRVAFLLFAAPKIRRRGWRLSTEVQGFPGFRAPTRTAARRRYGAGVGASLRKFKAFRAAGRQLERPRAGDTAPGLAPLYGSSRLSGLSGANSNGHAPEIRRRGWRLSTEDQGFPGCRAPTRTAARRRYGAGVGASQRKIKAFRAAGRQLGRPRAGNTAPGLAPLYGSSRLSGLSGANSNGRAPARVSRGFFFTQKAHRSNA